MRDDPENKRMPKRQWVNLECGCGFKGGQYVQHYDRLACDCGKRYWALQPKRNGPLVLFPHPGFILRPEELSS